MMKILCLTVIVVAACAGSVQTQLDGSVLTELTNQVDTFWQELFDGTSYSPDFLSSLSNLTDLQQKLNIPQTDVNFIQTLLPGNAASELSETVNSALLSGLQLADELEAEFCTPPFIQKGVNYPTECEGPEYIFTISGGYCFIDKDTKAVTCVKPQVILEKVAGTCTLKYTSPTTTFDKECKATKVFGDVQSGVLASYPGETFDLSQIYNLTQSSIKSDGLDLSNLFSNFLDTATPESAAESAASVAASG